MTVTDWFRWNETPVRPGVYQRNFGLRGSESPVYAYWEDGTWFWFDETPNGALERFEEGRVSNCQIGFDWRGLLEGEE